MMVAFSNINKGRKIVFSPVSGSKTFKRKFMRSDMHRVICEEPRHGGRYEKLGRRANLADELLPKFEGMRRPHGDRKWFGEHLGPLRRWLRSQVGRPWNRVYSEACAIIKPDSVVRNYIKLHILE